MPLLRTCRTCKKDFKPMSKFGHVCEECKKDQYKNMNKTNQNWHYREIKKLNRIVKKKKVLNNIKSVI